MRLRRLILAGSVGVAGFLACDEPFQPAPTHGSIAIVLVSGDSVGDVVPSRTGARGRGRGAGPQWSRAASGPRFDAADAADLDAARVIISGPTNKTEDLPRSGDFFESTVDSLLPGTYTVRVEGLVGGEVDHIGQTTATVTAGDTAEATTPFESFVPTVDDFAASTTGFTITATFNTITAANNYIVEFANNAAFTGAAERTTSTGSAAYQAPDTGTYYVRARSSNASVQRGRPGAAKTVRIIREPSDTTDNPIRAQQLGFGSGGALPTQSSYNIYPTTDIDWFSIRVCAADSLDIVARAALLTPASALVPRIRVFDEAGTTQLREVVAAAGANGRLGYRVPAEANYKIQITAANNTVGHYELDVTVDRSVYNTGALPCIVPVDRVVLASDSLVLGRGTTQSVLATTLDGSGNDLGRPLTWTSRDPAIATVDGTGAITGVQVGIVGVIAASEGKADTVGVRVTPGSFSTSLSEVRVSGPSLASGSAATLTVVVRDDAGNAITTGGLTVTFANTGGTSTGTIGAVADNNNGTYTANFTGVLAGTATTIGASIGGNAITSTLPTIAVTPGPVATVVVAPDGGTLVSFGQSLQLGTTVHDAAGNTPADAVVWSFTTAGIVTVDGAGLVTAVANGTASVIATAADKADTVAVTVAQAVASIVISPPAVQIPGGSANLTAQASDARGNAMTTVFTWQSLNPDVATGAAGQATAVSSGQATISASAGGVTGYALVTVSIPGATAVNAFTSDVSGVTEDLFGVWGTSSTNVFAVGAGGRIVRFTGAGGWATMASGTSEDLIAVWGSSAMDIFAVGASGTIAHYDGTAWTAQVSGTNALLRAVWGTSPTNVFAAGASGTILRYDGTSWTAMTSNTSNELRTVYGFGPNDVFAAGLAGTMLHFDGTGWIPQSTGGSLAIRRLWGTSGTQVFAAAQNLVLQYDGSSWSTMADVGTTLFALWGSSANDIYASGTNGAFRYNGVTWDPLSTGTSETLLCIWGTSSAGSLFVVGIGGTARRGVRGLSRIVMTPGGASVTTAGGSVQFGAEARGVGDVVIPNITFDWGSANTNIATITNGASGGLASAGGNGQVALRASVGAINGYALLTVAAPTQIPVGRWRPDTSGTTQILNDVFGFSNSNIYAVGNNGTISHFDGTDWTSQTPLSPTNVVAVWGASENDVWAAGAGGNIWHSTGGAFTAVTPSPTTGFIDDLWGSAPNDVYAVGANRTIVHYDGVSWTDVVATLPPGVPPTSSFRSIWGASASDIFVVGSGGFIMHYNGVSWSTSGQSSGLVSILENVWGTSSTDVWVSGAGGALLHNTGAGWEIVVSGTAGSINALWGASASDINATGSLNAQAAPMLRYNGMAWATVPSGTAVNTNLVGVWSSPSGDVFAVGSAGTILRGERGIATVLASPATHTLTALNAVHQFSGQARDIEGNAIGGYTYTWASTNGAVASVDGNGLVTAEGVGTASIIVAVATSAGQFADTADVTVSATFAGTLSRGSGAFADTVVVNPGEIGWDGDEVATIDGQSTWHVSGDANSLVFLVPAAVVGTRPLGVFNQGPGQLIQLGDFDVTGTFNGNPTAAAAAGLPGPNPASVFISLSDAVPNQYYQINAASDIVMRVTVEWQTGANLDIHWCNADCTVTLGNTDGVTMSNPEVSTVAVPAGSDWRIRITKADAGSEQTMAKVTFEQLTTVGTSVSAGVNHSCALDLNSHAWCWGMNHLGQLGNGTRAQSSSPVQVSGGNAFTMIDAANDYTCALTTEGDLYCWGQNGNGVFGVEPSVLLSSPIPVLVPGGRTFRTFDLGGANACAIENFTDDAYCWGAGGNGQNGNGSTLSPISPQLVSGGHSWSAIAANGGYTCGLTVGGVAYCWGTNGQGQLGTGVPDANVHAIPEAVPGAPVMTQIAIFGNHTCGIATTLEAYCWGLNGSGQIGMGTFGGFRAPSLVVGGHAWMTVKGGGSHTCGVTTADALYCWGSGTTGQLGIGSLANSASPLAVSGGGTYNSVSGGNSHTCAGTTLGEIRCWGRNANGQIGTDQTLTNSPTPVGGVGAALSVLSVGNGFACGLDGSGAAHCWGSNSGRQLGTPTPGNSPNPVAVQGGLVFDSISAGAVQACALTSAGAAWCWGTNTNGQLGDGTRTLRPAPVAVLGGLVFSTISIQQTATCGLEEGSGQAWCWGGNTTGQLGTGVFNTDSLTPVPVSGLRSYSSIAVGLQHVCAVEAVTAAGYCWGFNGTGQLGNGGVANSNTPSLVLGGHQWMSIRTASQHTCGVTTGGAGYCWGQAITGSLGNGVSTVASFTSPVAVVGGHSFTHIDPLNQSSCGVNQDGAAYCWGLNLLGQLGNGVQSDTNATPQPVAGGLGFSELGMGISFACGLTTGGAAYCWGDNSLGQIGNGATNIEMTPVTVVAGTIFQSPPPMFTVSSPRSTPRPSIAPRTRARTIPARPFPDRPVKKAGDRQ